MHDLNLAVIGNCMLGALIDGRGRFVWCCYPRLDGDPVFCSLLRDRGEAAHGYFDVAGGSCRRSARLFRYNTAVLVTTLPDAADGAIRMTDFCRRFKYHARMLGLIVSAMRLSKRWEEAFWQSL